MTSPSMKYEISGNDLQCLELQLSAGDRLIVSLECLNSLDEAIRPESWAIPPSPAGAPDTVAAEAAPAASSIDLRMFHNSATEDRNMVLSAAIPGRIIILDLSRIGGEVFCRDAVFLGASADTELRMHSRELAVDSSGISSPTHWLQLQGQGIAFLQAGGVVAKRKLKQEKLIAKLDGLVAYTPGIVWESVAFETPDLPAETPRPSQFVALSGTGTVLLQSYPLSGQKSSL
ncbi:MAG: AIM24 family protein [Planctomycetaceae bacterium]|nr:AIM24 family protein [Planctomycetaceae bacterium]